VFHGAGHYHAADTKHGAQNLTFHQLQSWLHGLRSSFSHPLASGRKFDVLQRSVQFALWSRASSGLKLFPWVAGCPLIGTNGYSGYFRNQLHEYADLCFAAHFLQPGDFFVDGGANVGTWSLLAALHAGAEVLAIEPAPDTLRVLRANIALNGLEAKVLVAPVALSDHLGDASMSGTGLTRSVKSLSQRSMDEPLIQLSTLSHLLSEATPALVKLDLEGHELPALEGAGTWLTERKIVAWCIEANTEIEAIALHAKMKDHGYLLRYYLPDLRKLSEIRPNPCTQYNLIFVRDVAEAEARLAQGRALELFGKRI
jgi:FkbM family methyltransferase